MNKLKKLFYVACFNDLQSKHRNPNILSKDSMKLYEQETRKRIGQHRLDYFYLLKKDHSFLDEYYLMAYALAHDPHSMYMSPSNKRKFL